MVLVLGSQNSSNSKRLAEIAGSLGPHAHLIDGVAEIRPSLVRRRRDRPDHRRRQRPEDVVQECIDYLQSQFGATIDEEWVREENVHFPLPKSLRELLPVVSGSRLSRDRPASNRSLGVRRVVAGSAVIASRTPRFDSAGRAVVPAPSHLAARGLRTASERQGGGLDQADDGQISSSTSIKLQGLASSAVA